MCNNFNDYILPVFSEKEESTFLGTCLCIDNYVITAGHVASGLRSSYTKSDEEWIYLDPLELRNIPYLEGNHEPDYAAFWFDGLCSPFSFSEELPIIGDRLTIICWQKNNEGIVQCNCNCEVEEYDAEAMTFSIITDTQLHHGSSGCPVFKGNKIYGILTMGHDPDDISQLTNNARINLQKELTTDKNKLKRCTIVKSTELIKKMCSKKYKTSNL